MAAKTTIKVALQSGAAKDDYFSADASGLTEDLLLAALNVLGNDPGSAHLYSLQQNLTGSGQLAQVNTAFSALGAKITINPDGTIAYDASNIEHSLAHLAQGEFATDTFVYTIQMGNGALSVAQVTLQIAGENDPPTLDAIAPVDIHDTAADDTPAAIIGTLHGHDVDDGAQLTYSVANPTSVDPLNHMQTKQLNYGTLTLHTDTGAYSFLADPDKIDALPLGSNAQAVFGMTVTDEHGASASQDMTFNLIGANDTAVITGPATGLVAEDGTTMTGGTLVVTDRDTGSAGFAPASGLHGTYGDFTFNSSSGVWDYTLRNGDANVQALSVTQHPTDTITVTSQDGTATQLITVTVNGANDAPTLDVPTVLHFIDTAADDPSSTQSATLAGHDIDNGAVAHYSLTNMSGVTTSGDNQIMVDPVGKLTLNTVTGAYSFQVDANYIDVIQPGTFTDSIGVQAVDEQTAHSSARTIVIEIQGANDTATISGTHDGSVTEDGTLTASGTLSVSDRDGLPFEPAFQSVDSGNLHGTYGNFTFDNSTGVWGYSLRNADANVQALGATDHPTDSLTVVSQDGTATQAITVTVNGADESPPPPPPPPPPPQPITFNVIPSDFDQFGQFRIDGFTAIDFIHFTGNMHVVNEVLVDAIPGDGNTSDSTAVDIVIDSGSPIHPVQTQGVVTLVGFTNFDPATQIV
jgi:VCBS repeat-containing protein